MRVSANILAAPDHVRVNELLLDALGGQLRGTGEVRKLEDFHIAGTLDHFDAASLAAVGGIAKLPYDGIVSGPFEATGKLQESDFHRITAGATLAVSPARIVFPCVVKLRRSMTGKRIRSNWGVPGLNLPHTRIDLSGVLGQQLDVQFSIARSERSGACSRSAEVAGEAGAKRIGRFQRLDRGPPERSRGSPGTPRFRTRTGTGRQIDSLAGDFTAMKSQVDRQERGARFE